MENFTTTLGDSIRDAVGPFMAAIPRILGFIVILVVGWIVAGLIARAVAALLRKVRFNDLSQRAGFSDLVEKMGLRCDAAGFIGLVTKWFIRLITLVVAFDALGLPAVSEVLQQLLLWLPNLIVGLVVLVIGGLAANAVATLVRGSTAKAGLGNPNTLANIARVAIWAFAIVIAANQIGVAADLVNILFTGTVAMLALALGLSFGLGGKDTAGEIVHRWYVKSQEAAPKLKRAAGDMEKEVRSH